MRWVQFCGSLSILWHCLPLGLEWKLTFSSPGATAEFSKPKKDVLFIIGDWNAKVGSQETPGVTGKFRIQNEAGQRLIELCQENALVITNTLFQQHKRRLHKWTSPMVNTEIRLIIFFAAKDGEALYSQQKQDQGLTVAQTMNSLLPNSDLNCRK